MAGKATKSVVKAISEYQYPWQEKLSKYKNELTKGVWGYWELGAWKPLGISARHRARLRKEVLLAGQDWSYDPERKEMRTKRKGHKCDRVSTENITQNWYFGNKKSMLIPNCLFRVGGSAVLLSNKSGDKKRAKYRLIHVVRTHRGADDKAFRCVYQEQDDNGKTGVSLSKDLMAIAGGALKTNITTLGPLVLPISEQLLFFATLLVKKFFNGNLKPYIPDFKLAFEHFCIHAGGRAVIDELEKNLQLSLTHVEASRMTLHRFGNTSSSSIWYELAYIEAKGRMHKGNRVWQIAFGSGFKCNSAVWEALRNVRPSRFSPWDDCIDNYPVNLAA